MRNVTRLRALLRKRTFWGSLYVALCLAVHHLWTKRRIPFVASILVVLTVAALLLRPHPVPKKMPAALPPPIMPASPPKTLATVPATSEDEGEVSNYRPRISLLQRAHRVVTLNKNYRAYCWLSRDRLLLVYSDGGDYRNNLEGWQGYAESVNLRTGKRQRLAGLTRLLNRIHGTPGCFSTSPSGKWLDWINYQTRDGWPFPVVAQLDGSHFQELDQDNFSITYWLDNHRWAEQQTRAFDESEPMHLNIWDVNHPGKVEKLLLASRKAQRLLRLHHNPPAQINSCSGGKQSDGAPELIMELYDRYSRPIPLKPLRFPKGADVGDWQIEPKRKIIACVGSLRVRFQKKERLLAVQDVWLRRAYGSRLRELGYVVGKIEYASLQWLPDGRHLSFVYKDALWTVPTQSKR